MKRLFAVIAILIFSLTIGATCCARSVTLHNMNNWKWLDSFGYSPGERLEVVAKHDQVMMTERWPSTQVNPTALKMLNPNIKVFRWYSLCVKSMWDTDAAAVTPVSSATITANGWWLKDSGGNIIPSSSESDYVDVGAPGYKEALLTAMIGRLAGEGFDGVAFDHWHPYMYRDTQGAIGWKYASDYAWYETAWKPFITYIVTGLHNAGYLVYGNCAGEYGTSSSYYAYQRSIIDASIYENGAVGWRPEGAWLDGKTIEARINALRRDPLAVWFAGNGITPTAPEVEAKIVVNLAMWYIGLPDTPEMQAKRFFGYAWDWGVFWNDLFDFDIGTPAAGPNKLYTDKFFWVRRFTAGFVLLNYDAQPVTYVWTRPDEKWVDPGGTAYQGQVTLQPHRALILKLVETPAIEPTPTPEPTPEPTPQPTNPWPPKGKGRGRK
jgi:hypothetical protein